MKKSCLSVLVLAMFGVALNAQDATRGDTLYKQQCVSCHGDRLEGRSAPPSLGGDFQSRWPTSDLIAKDQTRMPQDSPGTLTARRASGSRRLHSTEQARPLRTPGLPLLRRQQRRPLSPPRAISINSCAVSCSPIPTSSLPFRRTIPLRRKSRATPQMLMAVSTGPRGGMSSTPGWKSSTTRPSRWLSLTPLSTYAGASL